MPGPTIITWPEVIDLGNASALSAHVSDVLAAAGPDDVVVLDLARVGFLDTTGVTVLLLARRGAARAGVALRLRAVSDPIHKLLDSMGVASLFVLDDGVS